MAKRFLKLRNVGADPRVGPSSLHASIAYAIEFRVESLENLVLLLVHALRGRELRV
jgi:hypothetical protein